MVTNMQMKLAITSPQTILQKGMCKQQLHHHLQMYGLIFLDHFLTSLPYITPFSEKICPRFVSIALIILILCQGEWLGHT